jgi:hypothetical protein
MASHRLSFCSRRGISDSSTAITNCEQLCDEAVSSYALRELNECLPRFRENCKERVDGVNRASMADFDWTIDELRPTDGGPENQ